MGLTNKIFGSPEDFLNGKVSETWGNAGYTTQNVEPNSFLKNTVDITKWVIFNIGTGLGIFNGFKGLKTTRYFYNYIQNVTPVESAYIPDLVQTYAMLGVAQNQSVSETVQNSLKIGRGFKLKKYHQYNKLRYKNRQWTWQAYKTTKHTGSSITVNTNAFLDSLPNSRKYRVIDIVNQYSEDGQYYLDWLKQSQGIDSFHHREPDNTNRPKEKSIGVTVWSGNIEPVRINTYKFENIRLEKKAKRFPNLINVGDTQKVKIFGLFINPYDEEPDEDSDDLIDINQEELQVYNTVTLVNIDTTDSTAYYTYSITEEQIGYDYTEEHHYYITEAGLTNYPNFKKYWRLTKSKTKFSDSINSKETNIIDFIAPIPIKDWFEGKGTWTQVIPKLTEEDGIVKAIKDLSELTKDVFEDREEETSANSSKGAREIAKLSRKKHKLNEQDNYNKLGSKKEKHFTKSDRKLQRFITMELAQDRKLEFNKDLLADIKQYDEKRLKRHIEYMSDLIGINYLQYCASLMSQKHWNGGYGETNTYQNSLYLGAIFSNQTIENHHYWYEWAKRQYKLSGKENSYLDWASALQDAKQLQDLPLQVVKYQTTDKTHWGGFSFAFITKFEINGRVRKITHKRRLHDILRGKPITIPTLEALKAQIEPLRQIADDKYYYSSKSGKEYPIGGEAYSGEGYTESLEPTIRQVTQNYSYTFFCKNSGNGKITCYAICGLQFHTKMSDRNLWCSAWYDLGMEFQRLREKYIDKKPKDDIQVKVELETGSRKYRNINHIYNFGIVPLDYHIIKRMNATTLENFAQRAVLNYSFLFVEHKKKRGGLKYVRPFITIAGFIVSAVLTMYGQVWSWALFAKALAIAVAVSVIVNIAMKHIILPFLKALGLKGIVAFIVILVALIIASIYGGAFDGSALPYATETTGKVAQEVGNEIAKETIKNTVQQSLTDTIQSTINDVMTQVMKQLVGTNLAQIGTNAFKYTSQLTFEQNAEETAQLQSEMKRSTEEFNKAIQELEEKQEEIASSLASFDTRTVLRSLAQHMKIRDIDLTYEASLANTNALASYEYLSNFLEQKLLLEPELFDPIKSTDFTFNT